MHPRITKGSSPRVLIILDYLSLPQSIHRYFLLFDGNDLLFFFFFVLLGNFLRLNMLFNLVEFNLCYFFTDVEDKLFVESYSQKI